jgi:histone H3/H4
MISERLPPGLKLTAEVKEMILEACNEFVQCVSSEANEISTKENKSTIMPEHVVGALESLDFASYVETVSAAMLEMKEEGKELRAEKKKKKGMQMTPEEALAMQQKMFAEAKARYESGEPAAAPAGPPVAAPPPEPPVDAQAGASREPVVCAFVRAPKRRRE